MELPYVDPYRIKVVKRLYQSTKKEREKWIEENHFNLFNLTSRQVFLDLLTDSGTGGLSDKQWASMMSADESYAGSQSFENLRETVKDLTGYKHIIPAHQGRATENVLFSAMIKKGDIIPGNMHFFTTKIHLERHQGRPIDCTVDEAKDLESSEPFKGNIDLKKLEKVYRKYGKEHIPCCILTITCNSVGGQPVSLKNIKAVKALSDKYKIPLFYDAARFAQNAYFIKTKEEAYKDKNIREIVKDIFSYGDGMFMSSKKDGLVNMGGFIALNNTNLFNKASTYAVLYEGFTTYGGMSGRTMNALAQGLKEATEFIYLKSRISQLEYLGNELIELGVPIQKPIPGHAIFLNVLKIIPNVPRAEFPGHVLAVELYKEGGIRAGNGAIFSGIKDKDSGEVTYPHQELLRLTIPQRTFTENHLNYIATVIKNVADKGKKITKGY